MEEICYSLCAKLIEAGTGGYKIFYEEELLDCLPQEVRNRETLEAALKKLNSERYIDVKYARGNAFCIAVFSQYPLPEDNDGQENDAPADEKLVRADKKLYFTAALSAFAGGLAGGCVAAIVAAVL